MKFAEERHQLDVDEYAQAHEQYAPANCEPETILSTEAVFDKVRKYQLTVIAQLRSVSDYH